MRKLARTVSAFLIAAGGMAGVAQAAEVSLVSGFFRTEEREVEDTDAGKKTTLDLGGRYADQLDSHMFWFGQGMLSLKSYDDGDAGDAPSDSTSLSLGGGVRYYFSKLAESISPYIYGIGQYRNDQDGEATGTTVMERETNGLFYGSSFGIRLGLGTDFFVELETPLFDSALFATTKTETKSAAPAGGKTTDETRKTELYVDTSGAFESITVAMGMRL